MTIFTVHAPPAADGVAADPAGFVFVKDGFSWPALFIPPVWLIWNRLWLTLLIWVVAIVVLSILAGVPAPDASTAVMILFGVWFALEANGFRRWTLERRGYVLVGVVEGRRIEDAERRFFAEAASADVSPGPAASVPPSATPARSSASFLPSSAAAQPSVQPPWTPVPPPVHPPRAGPGIVGLFPAPGHRR